MCKSNAWKQIFSSTLLSNLILISQNTWHLDVMCNFKALQRLAGFHSQQGLPTLKQVRHFTTLFLFFSSEQAMNKFFTYFDLT